MTKRSISLPPLHLAACGAATALGNAEESAAASRAGLQRIRAVRDSEYTPESTGRPSEVMGCSTQWTPGFEGDGRLLQLVQVALEDMLRRGVPTEWPRGTTSIFLTLPTFGRETGAAADSHTTRTRSRIESRVMNVLSTSAVGISTGDVSFFSQRSGAVLAIGEAARKLHSGECDIALVIAADSLTDPNRIITDIAKRQVKTDDNPTGYIPGEAAVALLLQREHTGTECVLHAPTIAIAPEGAQGSPACGAAAISKAVQETMASAGIAFDSPGTLYLDLNGEVERNEEWGHALVKLQGLRNWKTRLPATSFGETGTASPLLGVMLAKAAFDRRYSNRTNALVMSVDKDGTRASLAMGHRHVEGRRQHG